MVSTRFPVTCGIDWAEDHHDVALVDAEGQLDAVAMSVPSAASQIVV
jgi:hypothetical protein